MTSCAVLLLLLPAVFGALPPTVVFAGANPANGANRAGLSDGLPLYAPRRVTSRLSPISALSLTIHPPPFADAPAAGMPLPIRVEATNAGVADAQGLILVVEVGRNGKMTEIDRRTVDVVPGAPTRIKLDWQPPAGGEWKVTATLRDSAGQVMAETSRVVPVAGGREFDWRAALSLSTDNGWRLPAILALLALALIAWLVAGAARSGDTTETFR